jgi:hypothetical protein
MPIRTGEAAPDAPPATVLQVVNSLRDRGLTIPITSDVLLRAGISDSLVPRTLRSLIGLELIEEDGRLTNAMEQLRRTPSSDFKARLAEHVRGVYEEVFQFTDPSTDDSKRIADAFRAYEPIGQRSRMVTLFLGLCEAAGIVPEGTARKSATPVNNHTSKKLLQKRQTERPTKKAESVAVPSTAGLGAVPSAMKGYLESLPSPSVGWTQESRDRWLRLFGDALDFAIPIRTVVSLGEITDENDEDDE